MSFRISLMGRQALLVSCERLCLSMLLAVSIIAG